MLKRPVRVQHAFEWPWSAIWFVVLAGVIVWQAATWLTFDQRQPVSMDRVEILNSPIRPGDALVARIYRTKIRDDCPVTSERVAIDQDGQAVNLGRLEWPGGAVGEPYVDTAYGTAPDMPDGNYVLRVKLTYHCPRDLNFEIVQPLAPFRVRHDPEAVEPPSR